MSFFIFFYPFVSAGAVERSLTYFCQLRGVEALTPRLGEAWGSHWQEKNKLKTARWDAKIPLGLKTACGPESAPSCLNMFSSGSPRFGVTRSHGRGEERSST